MDIEELKYIVVNSTAIAKSILSQSIEQLSEALHKDEAFNSLIAHSEGVQKEEIDNQSLLENGYSEAKEMNEEFNAALQEIDVKKLNELLNNFCNNRFELKRKISENDLNLIVEIVTTNPETSNFYPLHQYCMSAFHGGDNANHCIREAIADDELRILEENAANIDFSKIEYDDLETAILIKSLKTFHWLATRANLGESQIFSLLEACLDEKYVFERVYKTFATEKITIAMVKEKFGDAVATYELD